MQQLNHRQADAAFKLMKFVEFAAFFQQPEFAKIQPLIPGGAPYASRIQK
jgi:hypothetical protein